VSWLDLLVLVGAGGAAGLINTVVGSGTLITFPTLLAVGYPPVLANVSNTVGLVPGSVSGAIGYRRELEGQRGRLLRLGAASLLGGIVGALLLLRLPASAFKDIVPWLIALGCVLVVAQPWITRHVKPRQNAPAHGSLVLDPAGSLTYTPQASDAMSAGPPGPWGVLSGVPVITPVVAGWERVVVEDVSGTGHPFRFGRLVVTMP